MTTTGYIIYFNVVNDPSLNSLNVLYQPKVTTNGNTFAITYCSYNNYLYFTMLNTNLYNVVLSGIVFGV